jgi:hypothetical protein
VNQPDGKLVLVQCREPLILLNFFANFSDFETYISHPINAFGVIKRMSEEEMISFENQDLIKKHQALENLTKSDLASTDDFHTACSSLALIQESYSLRTKDISEGIIRFEGKVFESHYKFGFKDKFSISVAAWNRGWMDSSIEWLQKVKSIKKTQAIGSISNKM